MKNLVILLFLCFFLLASHSTYAGSNNITVTYPAASGSYNKIVLSTPANSVTCSANTAGTLFMSGNTLELCAMVNGNPVTVPAGEICFNRFSNTNSFSCPSGFVQGAYSGASSDQFNTYAGITVYSAVCCSTNAPIIPS